MSSADITRQSIKEADLQLLENYEAEIRRESCMQRMDVYADQGKYRSLAFKMRKNLARILTKKRQLKVNLQANVKVEG